MEPVLSKADFVPRFVAGEFGNMTPAWQTLEEYRASGYAGELCLRSKTPGAPTYYNVESLETLPPNYYIAAMIPRDVEQRLLIQGEVAMCPELCLSYTTIAKPMKVALAEQTLHANLTKARLLLMGTMSFYSYEWLMHLLAAYPDHVVEFSTYSVEYGTVPGHNTLFWEVRNY